MNSIHFHFNGDVNINLSLPDSADRPGYKKLVDSLEDYLHDAAEEAAVTEAEADSIVMVMRPDKTPGGHAGDPVLGGDREQGRLRLPGGGVGRRPGCGGPHHRL